MNITLPLVMIGRRASGKTTALAVLLGQGGFHSLNSGLDFSINTDDAETREYLFSIYKRIKSGVNPKPSEIHNLEKLRLYADINGERVPFEIPDVAGEHFEGGESTDQIIEKTRSELMDVISNAGVLLIFVDYDLLQEQDAIDYTNQVGVVLSELKKERYKGFIPPVVVAVTKFDKHPRYTKDFEAQQKLLEEELQKSEYLKQIKAIVTGAAGPENFCFAPISSYGGFKIVERSGEKTFVPPEDIAPSGLVELLEISLKKLLHQSFLTITKKPDSMLVLMNEKILKLQALMDFCPFPEIDEEIQEELNELKSKQEGMRKARNKKILQGSGAAVTVVILILMFAFVVKPLHERSVLLATGKVFTENRQDLKNISDIQTWLASAEIFVESNTHLNNMELVEKLSQVKKEYASALVEADEKRYEAAITAESTDAKKLSAIDILLEKAREDHQKSFLLRRRKEIFEREARNNLQVFLANLDNLPLSQQIKDLKEKIETAKVNKDTTALSEFQIRLTQCDKTYYQSTIEKLAVEVKTAFEKKEWLTYEQLQKLSAVCTAYVKDLPSGKMADKCAKFIEFYKSFESNGITCDLVFEFPATDRDYDDVQANIRLGNNSWEYKIKTDFPQTEKTGKLEKSIIYKLKDDFSAQLTFIDADSWAFRDPNKVYTHEIQGKIIPFAQTSIILPHQTDKEGSCTTILTITPKQPINTAVFPDEYE